MKKNYLTVLVCLCLFLSAGFAGDFGFKIEPLASFHYGVVNEYVYLTAGVKPDYKLSNLVWDVKPLWSGGAQASVNWRNVRISGRVMGSFGGKTGIMEDFDWLNLYYTGLPIEIAQTQITNYSKHNAILQSFLQWGAEISYTFKPHRAVSLSPFLSFTSRSFNWNSYGGYIQYSDEYWAWGGGSELAYPLPEWTPDSTWDKRSVSGASPVISYEQYVQYFSAGLQVEYRPVERLGLSARFSVAPYIFATGFDRHWQRNQVYLDIMGGSYALAAEVKSNYRITSWLGLCLSVGWDFTGLCTGPDFIQGSTNPQLFNALYEARKNPIAAWALLHRIGSAQTLAYAALGGMSQNLLSVTLSLAASF